MSKTMKTVSSALVISSLLCATVPSQAAVGGRPYYGPSADGAPSMDKVLQKARETASRAAERPEEAFDGHPSAFLQNFDLDSILNTSDSPSEPYQDMKGRSYRGLQRGAMEHPKTGAIRSLGITLLTPVLTPIVTPVAYLSRKFDPDHPAAKTDKGLMGFVEHCANVGLKLFGGLVGAPLAGIGYGLLVTFPTRVAQTAKRVWHSLAG